MELEIEILRCLDYKQIDFWGIEDFRIWSHILYRDFKIVDENPYQRYKYLAMYDCPENFRVKLEKILLTPLLHTSNKEFADRRLVGIRIVGFGIMCEDYVPLRSLTDSDIVKCYETFKRINPYLQMKKFRFETVGTMGKYRLRIDF